MSSSLLLLILTFVCIVLLTVLSQAVKKGKELGFDVVLCDTSGRKYRILQLAVLYLIELLGWLYINNVVNFMFSGLHTNYSLMEDLISCKKAVGKVVPGAPNVSPSYTYFFLPTQSSCC